MFKFVKIMFYYNKDRMGRNYGLDLLRILLMMFGPIFHVGMLYSEGDTFIEQSQKSIVDLSFITSTFRMELFYAISGFFSMLIFDKKGIEYFKESRINGLFIPTLFSILIILPFTNYIIYFYHASTNNIKEIIGFSHVWFIIVLSVINFIIYNYTDIFKNMVVKLSKFRLRFLFLIIFILSSITYVMRYLIVYKVFDGFLSPEFTENKIRYEFANLIFQFFMFCPIFIFGAVIYSKKIKFKLNFYLFISSTVLYLICYFFKVNFFKDIDMIFKILFSLVQMFISAFFIYNLVCVFYNFDIKKSESLVFLSKSALPFYLCHMPFVYFFTYLIGPTSLNNTLSALLIIFLTTICCFLSCYFIMKSKYLRIAFGIRS